MCVCVCRRCHRKVTICPVYIHKFWITRLSGVGGPYAYRKSSCSLAIRFSLLLIRRSYLKRIVTMYAFVLILLAATCNLIL